MGITSSDGFRADGGQKRAFVIARGSTHVDIGGV